MKTYFVAFVLALIVSLVILPFIAKMAKRFELMDVSWGRKIHTEPIPRVGGIGVSLAFFIPVIGLLFWDNELAELWKADWRHVLALSGGGLMAVGLGLWDDVKNLRARHKLLMQLGIAVFACALGIQIELVNLPFIGDLSMGIFAVPITVFWILGFMNAINLIDGIDGLCGGVVFIALVSIFFVAITGGSSLVAFFAAALGGAVLGFLRYNFNPAKVFLGDSGSYFLGFILAVMSIKGAQKANIAVAVLAPLLAMGLPIIDTLWSIIRRTLQGRPIFAADRGHIHHVLLDHGYSTKRTVITLYGISSLLAVAGIVIVIGRRWEAGMALVVSVIIIAFIARLLGTKVIGSGKVPVRGEKASDLLKQLPEHFEGLLSIDSEEGLKLFLSKIGESVEIEEIEVDIMDNESKSAFNWSWKNPPSADIAKKIRLIEVFQEYENINGFEARIRWAWRSELDKAQKDTEALLNFTGTMIIKRYSSLSSSQKVEKIKSVAG